MDLSIIICTRNRGTRLCGTLGALRALRTSHRYEIIWVDNASTDDTARVLKDELASDPASRLIRCERIGLGAARNEGWKASRGKIVAFTDDDCYPSPDYVDAWIAAFSEYPDVGAMGGASCSTTGNMRELPSKRDKSRECSRNAPSCGPACCKAPMLPFGERPLN
ncbi:glycosyltransferase family A protein [Bradyrhizobium sp. LLZ17]|uniref:Glycosyltransferase family A protein n=1 Tax=Bradyrhizobium sp. LLZ17 TaxID=3239388 RepID=A0AB39XVD1_9BRAD